MPLKHGDLISIHIIHTTMIGMVIPIGIAIPALQRQRQVGPWDFLASVSNERPYLKKQC